jgi:microcystin degradation protein MlrC
LILNSIRQQTLSPDAFTGLGCTLHDKRLVVVKSTQHFHAAFEPMASAVRYVAAPGALTLDYGRIPYTKRTEPYWPRVDNPFQSANAL